MELKNPISLSGITSKITLYAFCGIFAVSSIVFYSKSSSLTKENGALLSESKRLNDSLKGLEEQNKTLSEKIAKLDLEKKDLVSSLEQIKRNTESAQIDVQKYETQIQNLQDEKTYLEEMLINKTKQIEKLKSNADSAVAATPEEFNQKLRSKDAEISRLSSENQILSTKLDKLYKTANDKIAEINVAKITLEETVTKARRTLDDEWNSVNLGAIKLNNSNSVNEQTGSAATVNQPQAKKSAPASDASAQKSEPTKTATKKQGRILAINQEHGFVVVDLGKNDNLNPSAVLAVRKEGQKVATLTVLEIRDVMAACNIRDLQPGKSININDSVIFQ